MPGTATQSALEYHADIGVLTVIQAELDAALKALSLTARKKDEDTGTINWLGTIHSQLTGHDYRVVLSCIGEPGNPSSALRPPSSS